MHAIKILINLALSWLKNYFAKVHVIKILINPEHSWPVSPCEILNEYMVIKILWYLSSLTYNFINCKVYKIFYKLLLQSLCMNLVQKSVR